MSDDILSFNSDRQGPLSGHLREEDLEPDERRDDQQLRFAHGLVPAGLIPVATTLAGQFQQLAQDLARMEALLEEALGVLAQAHGNETASDFRDYFEKAETKAIGRALAISGYGTQFTVDLDEGERIVDTPLQTVNAARPTADAKPAPPKPAAAASSSPQPPSLEHAMSYVPFRKGVNAGRPMDDLSDESLRWILGSEKSGAQVKLMAELVLKGRAQRSQAGAVAEHSA